MATIEGLTKARMLEIEGNSVVFGAIDDTTGHLILTQHDGDEIDAGKARPDTFLDASETNKGVAELATQAEVNTGTDASRIVTPAKLTGRLATQAEVNTGTDTLKLVTPATLATKLFVPGVIPSAASFNSYTAPGIYSVNTNAIASSLTNAPPAIVAGQLEVNLSQDGRGVFQRYTDIQNQVYIRRYHSTDTWSAWVPISNQKQGLVNLLNGPGATMNVPSGVSGWVVLSITTTVTAGHYYSAKARFQGFMTTGGYVTASFLPGNGGSILMSSAGRVTGEWVINSSEYVFLAASTGTVVSSIIFDTAGGAVTQIATGAAQLGISDVTYG